MIYIIIGLIVVSLYFAIGAFFDAIKPTATEQQVPTLISWMLFAIFFLLLAITLFLISK